PSWQTFQGIFTPILEAVKQIWDMLVNGVGKALESLLEKFPLLAKVLEPLKQVMQYVCDIFLKVFDLLPNLTNLAKGFVDSVAGFVDKIFGSSFSSKDAQKDLSNNAPLMPNSTTYHNTNTQSNNNVSVNQTFNNTIQSSDPATFASATQREAIKSVNDMRMQIGGV
ncbi:hypothetical protein, partial [Helicobacter rodentium]